MLQYSIILWTSEGQGYDYSSCSRVCCLLLLCTQPVVEQEETGPQDAVSTKGCFIPKKAKFLATKGEQPQTFLEGTVHLAEVTNKLVTAVCSCEVFFLCRGK